MIGQMSYSARQKRQCPEGCGKGLLRKTVHLTADATLVGCTALPAEEEIERLESENADLRAEVEQLTRERVRVIGGVELLTYGEVEHAPPECDEDAQKGTEE